MIEIPVPRPSTAAPAAARERARRPALARLRARVGAGAAGRAAGIIVPLAAFGAALVAADGRDMAPTPPVAWAIVPGLALAALMMQSIARLLARHVRAGRHERVVRRAAEAIFTDLRHNPDVLGIVITSRDIAERRNLEEQLRRQAHEDPITGLPNRALCTRRLATALAGAARDQRLVAAVFIDLDGFTIVNDSLGHGAGDLLLAEAGARLRACARPGDTVARFGGDEFTLVLPAIAHPDDAAAVTGRMLESLRAPFMLDGHEVFVSASAGIACARPGVGPSPRRSEELLRRAGIAVRRAKAGGKDRATLFNDQMDREAVARLELETELRRAIERGELRVAYQPEVNLETGAISGAEALVRWQHPARGEVQPADFIPLAEETGLIRAIDALVLREACARMRNWQLRFPHLADLVIAVNISGAAFQSPGLVQTVAEILMGTGLPPATLRLEITESVLMAETDATLDSLRALHALGVRLAIDDFGTGYSSLAYLHRFPVDALKIDRSFVRDMAHDSGAAAIVQAVAGLAHTLGIAVIAEGIESIDQLRHVHALRCERGQGYLFAHGLPAGEMERILANGLPSLPAIAAERPAAVRLVS